MALAGVRSGAGTRIDLGLQVAVTELLGSGHKQRSNPVVILLTDGQPTPGFAQRARSEALLARALGFSVFAIGLGEDADMALLEQLAQDRTHVFFAPEARTLFEIYGRIAGRVLCE
jgi:uncharacterized protein YegL